MCKLLTFQSLNFLQVFNHFCWYNNSQLDYRNLVFPCHNTQIIKHLKLLKTCAALSFTDLIIPVDRQIYLSPVIFVFRSLVMKSQLNPIKPGGRGCFSPSLVVSERYFWKGKRFSPETLGLFPNIYK